MMTYDPLYVLVRSTARVDRRSKETGDIFLTSQSNNLAAGITGFLHREDDMFAHYFEGPREAVEDLLFALKRDWRHGDFEILEQRPLRHRLFDVWDMAVSDAEMISFQRYQARQGEKTHISQASATELLCFFAELGEAMADESFAAE